MRYSLRIVNVCAQSHGVQSVCSGANSLTDFNTHALSVSVALVACSLYECKICLDIRTEKMPARSVRAVDEMPETT